MSCLAYLSLLESIGLSLWDLLICREHSSLCSTTEFVLLIRKTPLYRYTQNFLTRLLQLLGGLCLHRRCRSPNNLINFFEKINPPYITSRKEEKSPPALMFTSMLTLKNIALMLMLMLISTCIISIQLYFSLCSHWVTEHYIAHLLFSNI